MIGAWLTSMGRAPISFVGIKIIEPPRRRDRQEEIEKGVRSHFLAAADNTGNSRHLREMAYDPFFQIPFSRWKSDSHG
jgi:hypothetical protein